MDMEHWSYLATALGFPAVVATIGLEIFRLSQERSRETQLELSRRYGEFLRLSMDRPEFELADFLLASEIGQQLRSARLQYQKLIALETLVSLFEDAHFLLSGKLSPLRREAWRGWDDYITYWMHRPDFRHAWHVHFASQYNRKFMRYMESKYSSP